MQTTEIRDRIAQIKQDLEENGYSSPRATAFTFCSFEIFADEKKSEFS